MSRMRSGLHLRDGTCRLRFDGREIEARAGDTVASALLANGIRIVNRSVKYRRVRGIFTASAEEPNALVTIGAAPLTIANVPATCASVRAGLEVRSQNRWPSLRHDVHSLLRLGGGLLSAGFYYKTFMWPSWRTYEPAIRRLAGLGTAPGASDLGRTDVEHLATDVLVAGGGVAGIAAALAAARAGARVVVCEREPYCGGELEFENGSIDGRPGLRWIEEALRELATRGARVLTQTAVIGGSDGLLIAHRQQGGLPGADLLLRIRPRALVIAMGAVEHSLAFIDNDLPGVMLLGAAERYIARYGVRVAANPVLFGNHDRLYAAAARLIAAGIRPCMIVDTRRDVPQSEQIRDELRRVGVECLVGHAVLAAHGRSAVRAASVAPLDKPRAARTVACDAILVSGGWSPSLHATLHEGRRCEFIAGAAAGVLELSAIQLQAWGVGASAARAANASGSAGAAPHARGDAAPSLIAFWRAHAHGSAESRQFVDLQNDVTVADLRQALAEGFRDIEHVKRYTGLGIGTEQGRTSLVLGAGILAELSGASPSAVGVSRARPPYQPITMMALCAARIGMSLRPERHTVLHQAHVRCGAVLEPAGLWLRPRYYAANGADAFRAGIAEALRVRARGGIVDASTLGKIEVAGPDAAAFLDSLYLTRASAMKVGRGKYMVNLREDGMVLDDGIVLRLAEDRFLATVSSGHAEHMLSHFEYWRGSVTPTRAVALANVTEAWSVIVVAGPQSRAVLDSLFEAASLAGLRSMAHMEFISGRWREHRLRVLRASFSGELAFELHCDPAIAAPLWDALIAAGLAPYGLEALDILRVEKGYLVDAEINGQTTPHDLGLAAMLGSGNPCVGRALLELPAFSAPTRPALVGLRASDDTAKFYAGAQIVAPDARTHSIGHVTSAVFSPHLRRWIGLGLVGRHKAHLSHEVIALDPVRGAETVVQIVAPNQFDPDNERMKS